MTETAAGVARWQHAGPLTLAIACVVVLGRMVEDTIARTGSADPLRDMLIVRASG